MWASISLAGSAANAAPTSEAPNAMKKVRVACMCFSPFTETGSMRCVPALLPGHII
jgi:hypothetical protein